MRPGPQTRMGSPQRLVALPTQEPGERKVVQTSERKASPPKYCALSGQQIEMSGVRTMEHKRRTNRSDKQESDGTIN